MIVHYEYREIMAMIGQCGFVTIIACIVPVIVSSLLNPNALVGFLGIGFTCMISLGIVIWFIGLDKYMKNMLIGWIKDKMLKKHRKE